MANQNFRVKNGLEVGVGGTILYAKDTGRIGIGRTDPGTDLDVAGNIRLSAGDPQIQLNDGGPRLRSPISNTLTIHTGGNLGTDDYERLRITSSGDIGIGTNNPGSGNILSVHGRTILGQVATGDATTKAEMISQASLRIKPHVTSSGALNFAQINNGDGIGLQFTNSTGTANWDIALQPYGGQVGIATDNPTQNLDINGATRFRGAIYDNNNSVGAANSVLSSTGSGVQWVSVSAGSDAGTLDGIDSTQFLRSDADDSASGVIDFLGGSSTTPAVRIKSGGNSWSEGLAIHPSSNNGYALTFYRTTASLTTNTNTWAIGNLGANSTNNFGLLRNGLTGGSGIRVDSIFDVTQSGTFRFGFTPTVGSNTIWHAGNHGSGSGLDADTLDGIQGGSFLRSDADDSTSGQITITKANNATTGGGQIYLNGTTGNRIDFNQNGVDVPTVTTRSSGTKLVLYPALTGTQVDYALGIHGNTLWYSVPTTSQNHRWYGGTTEMMKLYNSTLTVGGNTAWTAGNDGSGSGLDADTLDGINSGSFLRSDAADSYSSTIDATGTDWYLWSLGARGASSGKYGIGNRSNDSYRQLTFHVPNQAAYSSSGTIPSFGWYSNGAIQLMKLDSDSGNLWVKGSIQRNGNTVWDAGNDGSGSGLDADTLDGINSASFLRSDTSDTSSAMRICYTSLTNNEDYSNSPISIRERGLAGAGDGEDRDCPNLNFHWGSRVSKSFWMGANGYMNWGEYNSSGVPQVDGTFRAGNLLISSSSYQVWHTGNDGSGSGLDADFLDGINSASFLRSDVADTMTGNLSLHGNLLLTGNATTTNQGRLIDFTGFDKEGTTDFSDRAYIQHTVNTGGHSGSVLVISSQNDSNDGIAFSTNGSSQLKHNSNTIWTAGNDGSGSGLDADLLDGIDSSRIIYGSNANGTNQSNPSTALKSGFYDTYQTNAPTATWYSYINIRHTNTSNNYGHQIAGSFYSTGDLYNRNIDNGSYGSWTKIWNASNDGSGSGLDADTLDGINSGSFLRSDTSDEMVGTLTLSSGGANTYGWIKGYANNNHFITMRANVTGSTSSPTVTAGHYHNYVEYLNSDSSGFYFKRSDTGTYTDVAKITRTGIYFGSNEVWHAGNDGSGSGLDADLLDGFQYTTFMRRDQTYSSDLNTVALAGVYRVNTFTNGPSGGASYGTLLNANNASDTGAQFYINYNDGNVFTRGGNSSTFNGSGSNTAWAKQWSSENDGSGSGLDADTVDGYHFTSGQGISAVGNFGQWQIHSTYTNFNASISYWGWNYVQGSTNAPNSTSSQWYRNRVSLGSEYGRNYGSGDYWLEMAYPRFNNTTAGHMWVRTGEGGNAGSWTQVGANIIGNFTATGTVTSSSDARLKENITTIDNALSKVLNLRGVEYDRPDLEGSPHHIGVIAQEIEEIIPEVVSEDDSGYKKVAYGNLVGLLIEAIKEQQNKIDEYGQMIREQQNKIDELEQIIKDK